MIQPEDPYLLFTLTKHNMDTLFAIHLLSKVTGKGQSCFSYAGTKDKRGVTS